MMMHAVSLVLLIAFPARSCRRLCFLCRFSAVSDEHPCGRSAACLEAGGRAVSPRVLALRLPCPPPHPEFKSVVHGVPNRFSLSVCASTVPTAFSFNQSICISYIAISLQKRREPGPLARGGHVYSFIAYNPLL